MVERKRVSKSSQSYFLKWMKTASIVVVVGYTFIASAQEHSPKIPEKIDTLQMDSADDNLITGSVMREGKMLSYCINISDAATETRNSILRKELKVIESRIDKKLEKLAVRIKELRSWTLRRENFLKTGNESIINIFQSMRADAAASQLTELGPVLAASIIFKLEPKTSSAILTEMKPKIAAKITTVLTSAVESDETN